MSDEKLLLKEIKKKQSQDTKQVDYYELFETRSFGGERLKCFQKHGDYPHSRGDRSIEPKWGDLPVGWRETAGL